MKILLFLLLGLNILNAEFTRDNSTNIVTDTQTLLEWQDDTTPSSMKWEEAINYCENLTLNSQDDWRVPNINELSSIIDDTRYNPAIINKFENYSSNLYWSSTTMVSSSSGAFYVGFHSGSMDGGYSKTNNAYVRCVRAGQ